MRTSYRLQAIETKSEGVTPSMALPKFDPVKAMVVGGILKKLRWLGHSCLSLNEKDAVNGLKKMIDEALVNHMQDGHMLCGRKER